MPDQDPEQSDDEIRVLATNSKLAKTLGQHVSINAPDAQSTMIVRSWVAADDDDERRRTRVSLLELSANIENIKALQSLIDEQVVEGGAGLDELERNLSTTKANTEKAVDVISSTYQRKVPLVEWLLPAICFTVGGGVLAVTAGPIGAITGGVALASGATLSAKTGLEKWQLRVINDMKDQLPDALEPLSGSEMQQLVFLGDNAQDRLVSELSDKTWSPVKMSLTGTWKRYQVMRKKSKVRKGHAYLTSFPCPVPIDVAFRCIDQQRVSGDADTGSKISWSRPVDGGTSMRYIVLSNWKSNRDYFVISRTAALDDSEAENTPVAGQRYISATVSISLEELKALDSLALPRPSDDFKHGDIYMMGIQLTAVDEGNTKVDYMIDVDPSAHWGIGHLIVDKEIRQHVLYVSGQLDMLMRKFALTNESSEGPSNLSPIVFEGDDEDDDV